MRAHINQLARFIGWFEDNFGNEDWLRSSDEHPDGEWVSYLELPEYVNAKRSLDLIVEEITKES